MKDSQKFYGVKRTDYQSNFFIDTFFNLESLNLQTKTISLSINERQELYMKMLGVLLSQHSTPGMFTFRLIFEGKLGVLDSRLDKGSEEIR
jgi:hypothetical protein